MSAVAEIWKEAPAPEPTEVERAEAEVRRLVLKDASAKRIEAAQDRLDEARERAAKEASRAAERESIKAEAARSRSQAEHARVMAESRAVERDLRATMTPSVTFSYDRLRITFSLGGDGSDPAHAMQLAVEGMRRTTLFLTSHFADRIAEATSRVGNGEVYSAKPVDFLERRLRDELRQAIGAKVCTITVELA